MRVYKCDRCGKYFKREDLFEMLPPRNPIAYTFKIKKHVCPDCVKSFDYWWRIKAEAKEAPHAERRD